MQWAERTPEIALLAQAETSVVYLALTACFSDKYSYMQVTVWGAICNKITFLKIPDFKVKILDYNSPV